MTWEVSASRKAGIQGRLEFRKSAKFPGGQWALGNALPCLTLYITYTRVPVLYLLVCKYTGGDIC